AGAGRRVSWVAVVQHRLRRCGAPQHHPSHRGYYPPHMTTPALTVEDLHSIAADLLGSWAAAPATKDGTFRMKAKHKGRTTEPQFLTTYALAAHVYELARTVLPLLREGNSTASAPLVRAIYETALTAHWVAQAADGA